VFFTNKQPLFIMAQSSWKGKLLVKNTNKGADGYMRVVNTSGHYKQRSPSVGADRLLIITPQPSIILIPYHCQNNEG
jgi:hypothetical protein